MKKRLTFLLVLIVLINGFTGSALAMEEEIVDPYSPGYTTDIKIYVLSETSSVTLSTKSIPAGSTATTGDYYQTTTGSIVLRIKGSASTTFVIQLYTTSGRLAASNAVSISTSTSTVTFSNLSTSTPYSIRFENTGSNASTLSGTIRAV